MPNTILVTILVIFAVGSGCANATKKSLSSRPTKSSANMDVRGAQELERHGKLLDAALAYMQIANKASAPEKQEFQLRAADTLLRGNYVTQATQLLEEIDTRGLETTYIVRKQLLLAHTEISKGRTDRALAQLDQLNNSAPSPDARIKIQTLRAQAYSQGGNLLNAARERVVLDELLSASTAKQENQTAILQSLAQIPEASLLKAKAAPPDPFSGWIELALIMKAAQQQPSEFARLLTDWRTRYPDHSAANTAAEQISVREQGQLQLPGKIALLLPFQGQFGKAAEAIRDGFLAAYLAAKDNAYRPVVQIYDSGANTADIGAVYERALQEGAQFVVGPLDKSAVNALLQNTRLSMPVLALNYIDQAEPPANLYQFGLSPEDEAAQTAERAWLDGYNRTSVLIAEGSLGERLLGAFRERWEQLGGEITNVHVYSSKDNDFSTPIKKVLALDASEQRAAALKSVLNFKLGFTPRRRQDVDFVFLSAQPRQARLIRPQLNFFQANDMPVYSTSHVFSGIVNVQVDRDMDRVTFGDMPWVLPKGRRATGLRDKIVKLWPQQTENYIRFYAFGVDAFNLIPNINQLLSYRAAQHEGETGNLYIDDRNRIQRRLMWAEFKNGIPKVIDQPR